MYDANSISTLSDSIGFGVPSPGAIVPDETNKTGSSGMIFSSFHKLATIDNILDTMPKPDSEDEELLNAFLNQLRRDSSLKVLADVLDNHLDFDDEVDYSEIIISKLNLLQRSFGLAVAISSLELMMSSGRYNIEGRSIRESYATLKMELEGAMNEQGRTLSYGIISKYNRAILKAQEVIFQTRPIVNSQNSW